jgi:antitoxin (DNA-binding transcriptional repressor) of toxin-antitoxin stability system
MKSIDLSQVSALGPLVQPGSQEPIIVTQNGHTVAAIVPVDDQDVESLLLSVNAQFQAILERSQDRLDTEGGIASADVRKLLDLPPAGSEP